MENPMTLKVLIMNAHVNQRDLPARGEKPAMTFRTQSAAIDRPGDFPLPFALSLDEGQAPYQPGEYTLCPTSFQNDKYGGLQFARRTVLIPHKIVAAAAAKV